MDTIFPACNTLEDDRFESIEEFKDCIGREVLHAAGA